MKRSLLLGCMAWVCAAPVGAVDTDVLFHAESRKVQSAPQCADAMARTDSVQQDLLYHKAVCLLYGLQTQPNVDEAIALLRNLALAALVEAQMALADTLQQGDAAQQQEALFWYARASKAGDVRATLRHTRLSQRLQAAAPAAGDDPLADDEANAARQPGYHCHFYGLGKKICHSAID